MNLIEKFLQDHKVLILDGAMATELEGKGLDLNDALWSAKVLAERPDVIEQVHYEYFQAGADCAMTASYQATIEGFLKKGYSLSQAEKFISDSVSIAVKARDPVLAGSGKPERSSLSADRSRSRPLRRVFGRRQRIPGRLRHIRAGTDGFSSAAHAAFAGSGRGYSCL